MQLARGSQQPAQHSPEASFARRLAIESDCKRGRVMFTSRYSTSQ
jgi:hypothetical protein